MSVFALAVLIIAIALVFDYINGFHDAANSIATIVATRVLTPFQAVLWAAFFNFVAALHVRHGAWPRPSARASSTSSLVTPYVILAGLIGAIVWDLITWWLGLPTSSSHALIGGYAGAAMARVGMLRGFGHSFEALNVVRGEWPLTLVFIFVRAADRAGLRLRTDDRGLLAVPQLQPVEDGLLFPQAAVALGGGLQPLARLQRRAEDRGHHHRRAVHVAAICTTSTCPSGCCWRRTRPSRWAR